MKKMGHLNFALLGFIFFISFASSCDDGQIDINSASLDDLDKLIWVGPATAQKIINARPFDSIDDLVKVSGIGNIKLADIKQQELACVEGKTIEEDLEETGGINNVINNPEIYDEEEELEDKEDLQKEKDNKLIVLNEEETIESQNSAILNKSESIINLNPQQNIINQEKVLYKSENQKIGECVIYIFSGFLIFVIIILLIKI